MYSGPYVLQVALLFAQIGQVLHGGHLRHSASAAAAAANKDFDECIIHVTGHVSEERIGRVQRCAKSAKRRVQRW